MTSLEIIDAAVLDLAAARARYIQSECCAPSNAVTMKRIVVEELAQAANKIESAKTVVELELYEPA